MLDAKREIFRGAEEKVGKFFSSFSLTPNEYTLLSIVFALISFFYLAMGKIILALLFFLFASFLDFIDGAVARYKNLATKKGAYVDTIADRFVEAILLLGLLFLGLPEVFLPAYIWIFLILFGSMMTTYVKAAAKEKDLVSDELKGGLLARGERLILIIVSLIVGIFSLSGTVYILILVAILSNFTVFQRIYSALRKNNIEK